MKPKTTIGEWIGCWMLLIGAAAAVGSAERATNEGWTHYTIGYALSLPLLVVGAVVLLVCHHRNKRPLPNP
jgi:prolipoprotein diacylglyceryltransferase